MLAACRRGIPAARPDGLGQAFAGTVSRRVLAVAVAVTLAAAAVEGKFDIDGGRTRLAMHAVLAAIIALVITDLIRRFWCRRLGGITGDVLGALNEVGTCLVLLLMAGQLPGSVNAF
jgi:adenosylcobinamide-GDP ribazoletransferase